MTHAVPPSTSPPPSAEQLRETAGDFLAEATLDRPQRLVKNVALLGPESRNGYRYTLEAMQQAAGLYDGRPVFIDHPDSAAPQQRKLRDYAGQVVQPRFENQRVRGDLRLLGPNADWLLDLIEAAPADVGMSHVVLARRDAGGQAVARIERVVSVDIVAFPATTHSFHESSAASEETLRQLMEQCRVPAEFRTPALLRLLKTCAEPRQLLTSLEDYSREAQSETPRSPERPPPADQPGPASTHLRQAVLTAIRGRSS